jgi:hypothetical protein
MPSVRQQAMAAQSQTEVWNAVNRSVAQASAGAGRAGIQGEAIAAAPPATSSYARTMSAAPTMAKIEAVAAPALAANSEMPERLRREQVIGVVAAIDGHIIWADLFATPDLLAAYWNKLVLSYAAESIHRDTYYGPPASKEDALRFVSDAENGHETSEGSTAVYRYREITGPKDAVFILESLLPGATFEVHRAKMVQVKEVHSLMPEPQGLVR